jgi:hypothetical protein
VVHHLLMLFLLVFSLNYVSFISVLPPVLFVVFLFWFSSSLQSSSSHNYILAGCSSASIDSSFFNPLLNYYNLSPVISQFLLLSINFHHNYHLALVFITHFITAFIALVFITHFIIAFIAPVLRLLHTYAIMQYEFIKLSCLVE